MQEKGEEGNFSACAICVQVNGRGIQRKMCREREQKRTTARFVCVCVRVREERDRGGERGKEATHQRGMETGATHQRERRKMLLYYRERRKGLTRT